MRTSDGEEHSQDRQENPLENRRQGQTLPLRHVPEEKPETREDTCAVVLPQLPETKVRLGFPR